MSGPYYATWRHMTRVWTVWKRAERGGDRRIATGMSERTARRVTRLLNAEEERT